MSLFNFFQHIFWRQQMDAQGTERNYHSQSSVAATASFLLSGRPSLLKSAESAVIWLRFWFHRRNGAVLAHADAPLQIVAGSLWGNDPCRGAWTDIYRYLAPYPTDRITSQNFFFITVGSVCGSAVNGCQLPKDTYCIPAVSLQITGKKWRAQSRVCRQTLNIWEIFVAISILAAAVFWLVQRAQ